MKKYRVNAREKKSKKYRDVGFYFSIVDFFGFSEYWVGVGFLKYRDIDVDVD